MVLRSLGQTAEGEDFLVFSIAPLEPPGEQFQLLLWYSALAVPTLLNGFRAEQELLLTG
jgi:hypothetical protein